MSRSKAGVLILTLAASGCTTVEPEGYPLSATVKDCLAQSSPFIDAWGCVQSRYASGKMGTADSRITAFLKLGDELAGDVAARKLSDKEAKSRLAAGTADLDKM